MSLGDGLDGLDGRLLRVVVARFCRAICHHYE
jgi:hypothetical protein